MPFLALGFSMPPWLGEFVAHPYELLIGSDD
jgi:hypothetical protein